MDTVSKRLAWTGLIAGGALSIIGNVQAIHLPARTGDLASWRALPEVDPTGWAVMWAVVFPVLALLAVEMISRWTHVAGWLRYGAAGLIALVAVSISYTHLRTVLLWEGNSGPIATVGPIAIDGILLLSTVALMSKPVGTPDMDTEPVRTAVAVSETESVWTDELPDNWTPDMVTVRPDMDKAPDTVPDMDTLPAAPVDIVVPVQRRTRPDAGWKMTARELIAAGLSDREVMEKISADHPDLWNTPEAGRKAVSRLR